ncbi:hydroxymethylglutaryl-CoA lyase [Fibrella sp. HMF5335]|uniref:Hydroxymethylglutaryl-CoA lyase n=1 Tax=Fibrella rubiginis TaxID=2817060 RepID=A0A939GG71_9BACT|nr:hydroxymethylglutaryl-CoA lyase [Fibrella rubiginis]MBO0938419.1 hydroxymethylglutaryl-CoA lyase [Fibrella rubiginis]
MHLTECPRDAMQGLTRFIPTADKIRYLNALLTVGFDVLDFGSFVSPKAMPQMRDTAEVLAGLNWASSATKLLAIVANVRGAEQAVSYEPIRYLGFPLSVSETFQQRNTNKSIAEAMTDIAAMHSMSQQADKELVVYLSMGFGNPYGDPYSPALMLDFTARLTDFGIKHIVPSDTIGTATPDAIEALFNELSDAFPHHKFGAHLHALPGEAPAKIRAAVDAGVSRLEGAIGGLGGCPMAADSLTGNLPTEVILDTLGAMGIATNINPERFAEAVQLSRALLLVS